MERRTPRRLEATRQFGAEVFTPPTQTSLSRELRQVLNERNLLTAKSRKKGNFVFYCIGIRYCM